MSLLNLFSDKKRQPAECIIKIDNTTIDDLYPSLVEVEVQADRTEWTVATLIFETRRLEDGSWVVQDDERFQPWKTILIEAAFGDETEEVMRGFIKSIRAEYPSDRSGAKVTMTCQDHSLLLDRYQHEETWGEDAPITDAQIVTAIVQRYGVGIIDTLGEGQTVQDILQNTTDIRFIKMRADANGYEAIFRSGNLYFGEMQLNTTAQETIKVYAGKDTNCISFNVDDDGHQPDNVTYQIAAETGIDSSAVEIMPDLHLLGTVPANSTNSGLDSFTWRLRREGVSDDTQVSAIAQRSANNASMRIKAEGELDGSLYGHVLRTGEPVAVDGVGDKNNGFYYVDTATHRFDVDGYKVSFRLSRNAYGDNLPDESNPLEMVF